MLNIKKAITVLRILLNSFVFLSLFFVLCLPSSAYAQSKNVEFMGATEGAVFDVFVQGNYAYLCAGCVLVILDISVPAHPTKVGSIVFPSMAWGVYVLGIYAYVANDWSGLRVIDISSPENPKEVSFYDTPDDA